MKHQSKYVSKKPNTDGVIHYIPEEDSVWQTLYHRQSKIMPRYACQEFTDNMEKLKLSATRVPQPKEVSNTLRAVTGWSVSPVAALISTDEFFTLLANRQFPMACFIRKPEELDYLEEPDIFHEVFGHCPLILDQNYADFMEAYGKIALKAEVPERELLARLYWFSIEFGLIKESDGIKIYGGGILSSFEETQYAIDSPIPDRRDFNILDALRTPYRIDILQTVYYVLSSMNDLHHIVEQDLISLAKKARELGEFEPTFPVDPDQNQGFDDGRTQC